MPGTVARLAMLAMFALGGCDDAPPVPERATDLHARILEPPQPNILVIVADDLGVPDTVLYNPAGTPTPHLQNLADEGVLMTAGYASAAMCGPSRAGLLTGRAQTRFGFEYNVANADEAFAEGRGLPLSEATMGDALRSQGYVTGAIGKWHLGYNEEHYPTNRGFDAWVGVLAGATPYIDPNHPDAIFVPTEHMPNLGPRKWHEEVIRGPDRDVVHNEDQYLTEFWTDEAIAFIDAHPADPWFLYLSYTAPHTPLQVTTPYWDRFPNIADPAARVYAAMQSALDDGIGAVLDHLDALGIGDDTLVVFASDNGCSIQATACDCAMFRGLKTTHYEGGMRVPYIVRLPNRELAGTVYDRPVTLLDVFPTAVVAAGGILPPGRSFDGVNLVPYLRGQLAGEPHETLAWRMNPQMSARLGDEKAFWKPDGSIKAFFDLANDPAEQMNLADPGGVLPTRATDVYTTWNAENVPSAWPGRPWHHDDVCGEQMDLLL